MTNKELLYIEDALGHAQFMKQQCQQAASQLTIPALRQQAQRLIEENQKIFDSFYDLVYGGTRMNDQEIMEVFLLST